MSESADKAFEVNLTTLVIFSDIYEDNKNSPNDKIYFLSVTFRANWMAAQSFCKSYGMDLLALDSEHEAIYFMKKCEKSFESFEEVSHIGGVSNDFNGRENWFWITSNKRVNFDLKLKQNKTDKKGEQNCLQLVKQKTGFSYGRANCFGPELKQFVCQKVNVSKLGIWGTIMGR